MRQTSPETKPTGFVHVVRWEGETLSLISQWYTESWRNWEVIAGANPGIDPNRIRIGDRIRIPEALLKNRQPLPVDAISPSASRPEPKNPSGQRPALRAEEPEMFAPGDVTAGRQAAPKDPDLFEPEEIAEKRAERDEAERLFGPVE
jgi:hypothetical protein